jgi:hypothetical protein
MFLETTEGMQKPILCFTAAGIVMTLSNPFDLIRIRMQTMVELV